ncbi:MAG: hypothetical protein V4525_01395 [Pseudomonadota bacterium]
MAITSISGVTPYIPPLPSLSTLNNTAALSETLRAALANSNIVNTSDLALSSLDGLNNNTRDVNAVSSLAAISPTQTFIQDELLNTYYAMLKNINSENDFANDLNINADTSNDFLVALENNDVSESNNLSSMLGTTDLPFILNPMLTNNTQQNLYGPASQLTNNNSSRIDFYI